MRERMAGQPGGFKYPRPDPLPSRDDVQAARQAAKPIVVRFKMPGTDIKVMDDVLGEAGPFPQRASIARFAPAAATGPFEAVRQSLGDDEPVVGQERHRIAGHSKLSNGNLLAVQDRGVGLQSLPRSQRGLDLVDGGGDGILVVAMEEVR